MIFALKEDSGRSSVDIDVFDIIGRGLFFEGVTAQSVVAALRSTSAKNINVRINSMGGMVDEAHTIRAVLRERAAAGAKVNVTVLGGAASAATIVADAGTDVAIGKAAYFMIHEASAGTGGRGTKEDHEKTIERLRIANEGLVDMYATASAKRGKGKTAEQFRAAMNKETYFDAEQAVEWGLADRVAEEVVDIAACADVSALQNAPTPLREKYQATVASLAQEAPVAVAPTTPAQSNPAAHGGPMKGHHAMNKDELKAQHPELYAAVVNEGREAGITAGTEQERKRVLAHLKLGKTSGAEKVAHDAIASGASTMDEQVFAEYQAAAMNRRDASNRQADSDAAGAATAGAAQPGATASVETEDIGDKVVALMAAARGKKVA